MEFLTGYLDVLLHADRYLAVLAAQHPIAVYAVLFLIVFCETGLVLTPFLPGDSLLFAVGALAGTGALDGSDSFVLLTAAAIAGDGANYFVGRNLAPRLSTGRVRLLNQRHLDMTYEFYERYGRGAIIAARFVPIVRTFAPFVAGMGRMNYARFLMSNIAGAVAWVGICMGAGYIWGDQRFVQDNFGLVALGIVAVSVLPAGIRLLSHYLTNRRQSAS
jgi:membrane-associated protein